MRQPVVVSNGVPQHRVVTYCQQIGDLWISLAILLYYNYAFTNLLGVLNTT
jgi:hypothetical protein